MNVVLEHTDKLNAVLKLHFTQDDYATEYEKKLKKVQKQVALRGFRPGKAPMGLLKKMYGPSAMQEVMNEKISSELHNYITNEKLELVGSPISNSAQKQYDFQIDTDFEFIFDIALKPSIDIKFDSSLSLPFRTVKIDETEVENFIANQRKRFSENKDAEVIENDDNIFRGTVAELNSEGNVAENAIVNENVLLSLKYFNDDETRQKLIGAKKDDIFVINPKITFENAADRANILGVKKEDVENITSDFSLQITEIQKFVEAELNEDFFQKVYGEEVTTLEQYHEKVREAIRKDFEIGAGYLMVQDFKKQVEEEYPIELPEEFFKRYLLQINENTTIEQIDNEFDDIRKNLKWRYVKDEIVKQHNISIEKAEVVQKVKQLMLAQFGITTEFPELNRYVENMLKDEDQFNRYYNVMEEEKIMLALKDNVTLNFVETSKEEFDALLYPKYEHDDDHEYDHDHEHDHDHDHVHDHDHDYEHEHYHEHKHHHHAENINDSDIIDVEVIEETQDTEHNK